MIRALSIACLSTALLVPNAAFAKPPPPPDGRVKKLTGYGLRHQSHFMVGLHAVGFLVAADVTDSPIGGHLGHGGGGGVFLGGRLGPFVGLEASYTMTYNDDPWSSVLRRFESYEWRKRLFLMLFMADLKFYAPTFGPVEPFFQAGGGFAMVVATYPDDVSEGAIFATAPAFNIGGGFDIWLSRYVSLGLRTLYRGIAFGDPEANPGTAGGGRHFSNYINGITFDVFVGVHL